MARLSLTICGLSLLLAFPALGQQSTTPQISTGVGSQPQYRTPAAPRSPSANAARPGTPGPGTTRFAPARKPAAGAPIKQQVAPKKDPVAPGTPNGSASSEPVGPPYPTPEVPKPARPADM